MTNNNDRSRRFAGIRESVRGWWPTQSTDLANPLDLQVLEDRILYSATPLPIDQLQEIDQSQTSDAVELALDQLDVALAPATDASAHGSPAREAVFIDASLDDLDTLLQQYLGNDAVDVFLIESDENGISWISDVLSQSPREYAAVHIVTHASDGNVQLAIRG